MKHDPGIPGVPRAQPRVLLLEDQMLIMLQAEDVLRSGGYSVITTATTRAARAALDAQPVDAAVIDISVGARDSFPIAEELVRRRIPFLFTSGHSPAILPARFRTIPLLQKPYLPSELLAGMTVLMLDRNGGSE